MKPPDVAPEKRKPFTSMWNKATEERVKRMARERKWSHANVIEEAVALMDRLETKRGAA
jgi:hypothetical protein